MDSKVTNAVIPTTTLNIILLFLLLAAYNVVELTFIIFSTFRSRRTLYFWSFLVATWGIAIYSTGFLIKDIHATASYILYCTLIMVGWICMITGQSVVLYSRLHLIVRNPTTLRRVLYMIIGNAIILHPPIIVLIFGSNSSSIPERFIYPYSVFEKIQVTIFFLQEITISALYIIHTLRVLGPEGQIRGSARRKTMAHLVYVNAAIVLLDITILTLEYKGLYDIQTAYKAFVYSVKLKLEFSILNKLVDLTTRGERGGAGDEMGGGSAARAQRETFGGAVRKIREGQGYSAFVCSGGETPEVKGMREVMVVTTTEIVVADDDASILSERDIVYIEKDDREYDGLDGLDIAMEKGLGIRQEDSREEMTSSMV